MRLGSSAASFLLWNIWEIGGAKRDRTADLYNAIVALSQLSYSPLLPFMPCLMFLSLHWLTGSNSCGACALRGMFIAGAMPDASDFYPV